MTRLVPLAVALLLVAPLDEDAAPARAQYATGRRLMTDEVNAVVAALFAGGATDVLVNDSHGDMQNLLHTELRLGLTRQSLPQPARTADGRAFMRAS